MATGGPGHGYPRQIFTELATVTNERYICGACDQVLMDPIQNILCGHHFCRACIFNIIATAESPPCPSCLAEDNTVTPVLSYKLYSDKALRKEMYPLRARCPECRNWCGSFQDLDLNHWNNCPCRMQLLAPVALTTMANQGRTRDDQARTPNVEIEDLYRRIQQQETTVHLQEVALAEINAERESGSPSCDGILLWKITNYREKKERATQGREVSMYSTDFFTSRHGYRLKGSLYLNGDGIGKGTHLSLFLVVCKGRHDALLMWPFQQLVIFQLVKRGEERHTTTLIPDPNARASQQPTHEQNVGMGHPVFAAQQLVEEQYVRDDILFIRIQVDIIGLTDPAELICTRRQ